IMMVHYFGIPQDINRFIEFAAHNKLFLIEDNSHGYGSSYDNKPLGTFGDIGISSPRKSLPILNGGMLYLKEEKHLSLPGLPLEPLAVLKSILKNFAGMVLDNFPSF